MEVFAANASIGALVFEMNPLFLTISATLTCSMAFMLPVSTGPNAIGKKKGMDTSTHIRAIIQ